MTSMPRTWSITNEDLPSVVRGLDVGPEDYILVIGGSGDQAFALLEYAERVLAVDIEQYQVTRMQKQAKSLEIGDYETFLRRRLRRKITEIRTEILELTSDELIVYNLIKELPVAHIIKQSYLPKKKVKKILESMEEKGVLRIGKKGNIILK